MPYGKRTPSGGMIPLHDLHRAPQKPSLFSKLLRKTPEEPKHVPEMAAAIKAAKEEKMKQRANDKIDRRNRQKEIGNKMLVKACLPPLLKTKALQIDGPIIHFSNHATVAGWHNIDSLAASLAVDTSTNIAADPAREMTERLYRLYEHYNVKGGSICGRCKGNDLPPDALQAAVAIQGHRCSGGSSTTGVGKTRYSSPHRSGAETHRSPSHPKGSSSAQRPADSSWQSDPRC